MILRLFDLKLPLCVHLYSYSRTCVCKKIYLRKYLQSRMNIYTVQIANETHCQQTSTHDSVSYMNIDQGDGRVHLYALS